MDPVQTAASTLVTPSRGSKTTTRSPAKDSSTANGLASSLPLATTPVRPHPTIASRNSALAAAGRSTPGL